MTIERGGVWGAPAAGAVGLDEPRVATTDADVAALAAEGRERGGAVIELGAVGGDVARTIGLEQLRPEANRYAYPFDLGLIELDDGPQRPFVVAAVAHRRFWRGEFAIVANCGWLGGWYVGPKSHPNDGLLDVTLGTLSPAQRLLARRRLPTGTHLPHPDLRAVRRGSWEHRFASPVMVSADGRSIGRARSLRVSVLPDCFILIA